jgi:hypothetical protein
MNKVMTSTLIASIIISAISMFMMSPSNTIQTRSACVSYIYTTTCINHCVLNQNYVFSGTPPTYGYLCDHRNYLVYASGRKMGSVIGGGCYINSQDTCINTCY